MSTDRDASPLHEETAAARAGHRRTRTVGVLVGAVIGAIVGVVVLIATDSWHTTGNDSNPAVYVFGLPMFTAAVGAVMGWLFSGIPEHGVVDAPVRDARFARSGRAATSVQGQEPGSPVEPDYAPDSPERPSQ
jgi:hypothetical protein